MKLMLALLVLVLVSGLYAYCYQESVSTATSCGGLNTGTYYTLNTTTFALNYSKPNNSTNNSLWTLKAGICGYPNPCFLNLSIPTSCWNLYTNKIQLLMESTGKRSAYPYWWNVSVFCNGTNWVKITELYDVNAGQSSPGAVASYHNDSNWGSSAGTNGIFGGWALVNQDAHPNGGEIYEEAMWWEIIDFNITNNYTANQSDAINYSYLSYFNATSDILDVNATVTIANINYPLTKQNISNNYSFTLNLIPPIQKINQKTDYNVSWNYTYGTRFGLNYTQRNYTITVNSGASVCNASYVYPIMNTSIYEEKNKTYLQTDIALSISLYNDSNFNYSINLTNKQNFSICSYANITGFKIISFETYLTNTYNQRNYFIQNETIQSGGNNYSRYLETISETDLITFTVYDSAGSELKGGTIKIYRYYPQNNSLLEIADALISEGGQANAWLTYADVTYQLEVWQNYQLRKVFAFQTLPCYIGSTCSITLNLQGTATGGYLTSGAATTKNCVLDNTTSILTCTITDSSNSLGLINLSIYNSTINQTILLTTNSTTYNNATTTITANLGPLTGQTYFVQLTGRYGTQTIPIFQQSYDFAHGALFGMVGIFIAYILIIALTGAGAITGPSGSGIGAAIGLIASWGLRLIEIDVMSLSFAIIMAIALAWILKA